MNCHPKNFTFTRLNNHHCTMYLRRYPPQKNIQKPCRISQVISCLTICTQETSCTVQIHRATPAQFLVASFLSANSTVL